MKYLADCLAVGAAGFVGAISRWLIAAGCGRLFGPGFPFGTLVVNVSGSFLLGWFLAIAGGRLIVSETTRLGIAVGFVGAFTTFSTLMFESSALWNSGAIFKASLNIIASIVLGLLAVRLGLLAGAN